MKIPVREDSNFMRGMRSVREAEGGPAVHGEAQADGVKLAQLKSNAGLDGSSAFEGSRSPRKVAFQVERESSLLEADGGASPPVSAPGSGVAQQVVASQKPAFAGAAEPAPKPPAASNTPPSKQDAAEWPDGKPEDYIRNTFTPKSPAKTLAEGTTREGKIETILAALPDSGRAQFKQLVSNGSSGPNGSATQSLSDAQIDKAFDAVLTARNTPGKKTLDLELTPTVEVERSQGGEGGAGLQMEKVDGPPVKLSAALEVSADGKVNGQVLPADLHARLSTEVTRVPLELKEQTLKEAGLSADWLGKASPQQKEYALAKIREASMTPGSKTLDFSFSTTTQRNRGDAGEVSETVSASGALKLDVGTDGKINGKQLTIETALATSLQMDKLPLSEKRAMVASLGFDAQAQNALTAKEGTAILTRAAMATQTPGDHRLEVNIGKDKYQLALKVGKDGELEGAGAAKIPPPPKKKWWQAAVSAVLTVVGFVFPPVAPIAKIINGVIGVVQGIRNRDILGVVGGALGVGGNIATLAGNAGLAATLGNAATVANAANGVVRAVKTGDIAGLIGSAISAAGAVGTLAGTPISSDLSNLGKFAGATGGVVNAVRNRDYGGLIQSASGAVDALGTMAGNPLNPAISSTLNTVGRVVSVGQNIVRGNYGDALDGIVDLAKPYLEELGKPKAPEQVTPQDEVEPQAVGRNADRQFHAVYGQMMIGSMSDTVIDARGNDLGLGGERPLGGRADAIANGSIAPNSFFQDSTGNCTMLSTISASALWKSGLMESLVTISGETATVRLHNINGEPITVLVDAKLPPTSGPIVPMRPGDAGDSGNGMALSYLIQKAIVAARPQLMQSEAPENRANWGSVYDGFVPDQMMQILTGKPVDSTRLALSSSSAVYDSMLEAMQTGRVMTTASKNEPSPGVIEKHAYTVIGAFTDEAGQRMVRLKNPYRGYEPSAFGGTTTDKGLAADGANDGIFSMPLGEYMAKFSFLYRSSPLTVPIKAVPPKPPGQKG